MNKVSFMGKMMVFSIGFFLQASLPLTNVFFVPHVRLFFFGFTFLLFLFLLLTGLKFQSGKFFLIGLLFFVVVFISLPFTRAPEYASLKVVQMIGYFFLLPLVLINTIRVGKQEDYFINGLFLAGIFFIATTLYYYGNPYSVLKSASRFFRLQLGSGGNPIMTSRYLGLSVITFVYFILVRKSILLKASSFLFASVAFMYMVSTGSKGPMASLLLSLLVFVFFATKYRKTCAITLIVCGVISGFLLLMLLPPEFISQRFFSKIENLSGRLPVLLNTINYLFHADFIQLLLGHGLGDFGFFSLGRDTRMYPHNIFIEILFETGMVGLILFLWWVLYPVKVFFKINKFKLDAAGGFFLSVYLYSIINAQSSGDLPTNYFIPLFAALLVGHTNIVNKMIKDEKK